MFVILMFALILYVLKIGFWRIDDKGRLIFENFISWQTALPTIMVCGIKIAILILSLAYIVQIENDPEPD